MIKHLAGLRTMIGYLGTMGCSTWLTFSDKLAGAEFVSIATIVTGAYMAASAGKAAAKSFSKNGGPAKPATT